jgi:hypothetical protein
VEGDLAAGCRRVDSLVTAQVALDEPDVAVYAAEVSAASRREVVEDDDLCVLFEESADEIRSDEPAAAGDEDFHNEAGRYRKEAEKGLAMLGRRSTPRGPKRLERTALRESGRAADPGTRWSL